MNNIDNENDEVYCLSMWGCLYVVLQDYDIDVSHITPKMGEHMIEDLMELLENCGYVGKVADDGK